MNSNGMPSAPLVGSPLEPLDLRALAGASPRNDASGEPPLPNPASNLHMHNSHPRRMERSLEMERISQIPGSGISHVSLDFSLLESMHKLEADVGSMNQDLAYFRHVLDFQNLKIEKLTLLLLDLLHNKDVAAIVGLLQEIQTADPFGVDAESVNESLLDSVHDSAISSLQQVPMGEMGQLHQVAQAAVQAQKPEKKGRKRRFKEKMMDLNMSLSMSQNRQNMNMAQNQNLNQSISMAQSQNQNISMSQNQSQNITMTQNIQRIQNQIRNPLPLQNLQNQQLQGTPPRRHMHELPLLELLNQQMEQPLPSDSMQDDIESANPKQDAEQDLSQDEKDSMVSMPGLEVVNINEIGGRKRPKVEIDFLHNPMTVKEIYDEFTKGFRGQPPLREMDERFGKHQWRGDSRSKESKRFQRRKKLCNAIERGMEKYGKSQEEIMNYIEEFRGDKSLTWVMNGHLPSDLLE